MSQFSQNEFLFCLFNIVENYNAVRVSFSVQSYVPVLLILVNFKKSLKNNNCEKTVSKESN